VILIAIIASPPIALIYKGSYYDGSMIHATYIWMLMNTSMGVFIECGYGFEVGMGVSTLIPKGPRVFLLKITSK
jgi:hypothetical protein